MTRSSFYYHQKQSRLPDKYKEIKEEVEKKESSSSGTALLIIKISAENNLLRSINSVEGFNIVTNLLLLLILLTFYASIISNIYYFTIYYHSYVYSITRNYVRKHSNK